jgi:hypothetical protein
MEHDGIFFTPADDDDLELSFFNVVEDRGTPIDGSEYGYKYHIAFFKGLPNGEIVFDESFEAIFADPATYIRGLVGCELFGCILKKTTTSTKWFNDYLKRTKESVKILNEKSLKGN